MNELSLRGSRFECQILQSSSLSSASTTSAILENQLLNFPSKFRILKHMRVSKGHLSKILDNRKWCYLSMAVEESVENKTKYTMDPGIYYLLEADEDNTNRYQK